MGHCEFPLFPFSQRVKSPRLQLYEAGRKLGADVGPVSYGRGLLIQICMVLVGMVFAALQIVIYVVHNRRVSQSKHKPVGDGKPPQIYVP